MTTRNTEQPQGESGSPSVAAPPPSGPHEHLRSNSGNTVFKSGPLFLSSKGIGWTSWKKRWFILTRTSLVFFRSDPNAVPQKGSEVNLTLGGIDLNNSGRVDFKVEKKLLTVLFPDGRDGRAFTLKAETLEDLFEWKDALENALAQAPSPSNAMGQNGIFRNDQTDSVDGSSDQQTEIKPITSKVIGRPVLLALEEVDGTPSFLEKALQFIEEHGVKVEGILRQAAYVQDVERRIREYEQGKTEFSAEEDAHVIADCVKYIIRELPSSPVPASCCKALLEAIRTDRAVRVNNVRAAICDTFPEPNRRLLQRILTMMQKIVSNKAENRMSCSAVAACMAPLLLRPLLAGDCEIENDFDVGGDNSLQLLQAAAAANHAQVIVITLLDEYDKIFGEGSMTPDLYSDEDESGSETEEETEDDVSYEDDESDNLTQESDAETDDEIEIVSSGTCSGDYDSGDEDNLQHDKEKDGCGLGPNSREADVNHERSVSSKSLETSVPQPNIESNKNEQTQDNKNVVMASNESAGVAMHSSQETSLAHKCPPPCMQKSTSVSNRPRQSVKSQWGRTSARKNLSMESVDFSLEDEADLQGLEASKSELENKIAEEAEENAVLHENLERHKRTMHRRRLALEQDVERLQEQLQIERDTRAALEAGLKISKGPIPNLATVDKKTKAELEEVAAVEADIANLKRRVDDLGMQLNQQREQTHDYQEKQNRKDKGNDNETLARSHCERSRSKNANLNREENENEEMPEMSSSVSKHTPQPTVAKTSSSKKSAAKGEERRSQITNDLQNMEKSRVSSQEQNDGQFYDKWVQTEEQGSRKPEKVKKLESQSLNQAEREKRSEGQVSHTLDRGKSESNVSIDIEKGRVVEGQPSVSQKKSTR